MNMRTGIAERTTSVNAQEHVNAKARQVIEVVRHCTSMPEASNDAIRMSSISLV